ncbi:hypothetical protein GF377_04810 [candidate division GN15 bacterium]|nr:hypothetical protein [candidate division GN15 bacterium]
MTAQRTRNPMQRQEMDRWFFMALSACIGQTYHVYDANPAVSFDSRLFKLDPPLGRYTFPIMPRRIKKKPSLLAPAGNLLRKLSDTNARLRRRVLTYSLWGLGILFVYGLTVGTYSLPRIVKLHLKKQALVESNRQLTAQLIDASREREMLRYDARYIEHIARTRYFMVKPDELIYRFRIH